MATSGSLTTTAYNTGSGTRSLKLEWERKSYDVEKNATVLKYKIVGAGTYTGFVITRNIKCVIGGTTVYTTDGTGKKVYNGTVLKEGTITIKHNADGTKSLKMSLEAGIFYSEVNCSKESTFTLDTIPRASSVSFDDGNIGEYGVLVINSASSSFTHTVTWSCTGAGVTKSGTFMKNDGTSITKSKERTPTVKIPEDILYTIPSASSIKVTITCTTYNGSTEIGTSTCTFTAKVSKKFAPTVSYTSIVDSNSKTIGMTGNSKELVLNLSTAKISGIKAVPQYDATIKSIKVVNDKQTEDVPVPSSSSTTRTASIEKPSSAVFQIIATDSRGLSTTLEIKVETVHEYFKPSFRATINRESQVSKEISATFSGTWYSVCNDNYMVLEYKIYNVTDDTTSYVKWIFDIYDGEVTDARDTSSYVGFAERNGNSFSGSVTFDYEFDYTKNYEIMFNLYDSMSGSLPFVYPVLPGIPICDWGKNNFNFNVPVTFNNVPIEKYLENLGFTKLSVVDYIIEQGSSDGWKYRIWKSGFAECWKTVTVNTKITTTWGSLYAGATKMSRQAYPEEIWFKEKPQEIATVQGASSTVWLVNESAGNGVNNSTHSAIYNVVRPSQVTTAQNYYIHLYVSGLCYA